MCVYVGLKIECIPLNKGVCFIDSGSECTYHLGVLMMRVFARMLSGLYVYLLYVYVCVCVCVCLGVGLIDLRSATQVLAAGG